MVNTVLHAILKVARFILCSGVVCLFVCLTFIGEGFDG